MQKERIAKRGASTLQKRSRAGAGPAISKRETHPTAAYRRVKDAPAHMIAPGDITVLQRAIGNRAVERLMQAKMADRKTLQRQDEPCPLCPDKEEEKIQRTIQRQAGPEQEEEIQAVMQQQTVDEEEEMQPMVQRQAGGDEEEEMQPMMQRQAGGDEEEEMQPMVQRQAGGDEEEEMQPMMQQRAAPNEQSASPSGSPAEYRTGLPERLKTGIENLSGLEMSDVSVHRNSKRPASVGALAYTQGDSIYVAPGQEKHLPHEAWHVVQQKEGRVAQTRRFKGVPGNDNPKLEKEADDMGQRALRNVPTPNAKAERTTTSNRIQRVEKPCPTDKYWRYTVPSSVKRSVKEIQMFVGETADGAYGPKTCEAVKKYQKKLQATLRPVASGPPVPLYADNIDGKWGPNTEAAHALFIALPYRSTYNCAGFAFKTFAWHNLNGTCPVCDPRSTRDILSTMTATPCSGKCSPHHYKFWLQVIKFRVRDSLTGTLVTPEREDFHIVGGKTDKKGKGPSAVLSKNGGRPIIGPKPPKDWELKDGEGVPQADNSPHPRYKLKINTTSTDCYCGATLPA